MPIYNKILEKKWVVFIGLLWLTLVRIDYMECRSTKNISLEIEDPKLGTTTAGIESNNETECITSTDFETTTEDPIVSESTIYTTIASTTEEPPPSSTTTETSLTTNTQPETPIIILKCKRSDSKPYVLIIQGNDVLFRLQTLNETSIEATIKRYLTEPKYYELIYFFNRNEHIKRRMISFTTTITDLKNLTAYTFCLMAVYEFEISPFNCRSHYLAVFDEQHREPLIDFIETGGNKALFISLTVLGVIIFMIIGGVAAFFVLRCRPNWLRGNKRIIRMDARSPKVVLRPKKQQKHVQFPSSVVKNHRREVLNDSSDLNTFTDGDASSVLGLETPNSARGAEHYEKVD